MGLDFPATARALWALFDKGGPRPEYLLPVLYSESGFDPSRPNQAGSPHYGLGQTSGDAIAGAGMSVADFLALSASQQISQFVGPFMLALVKQYGPLRSATRVYQGNYVPSSLAFAHGLDSVISSFGQPFYTANQILDWQHKGAITVRDMAHSVEISARTGAVQSAIANTYTERPGEHPHEPVLGEDFSSGGLGMFAAAVSFAALLFALVKS